MTYVGIDSHTNNMIDVPINGNGKGGKAADVYKV